MRVQTAA